MDLVTRSEKFRLDVKDILKEHFPGEENALELFGASCEIATLFVMHEQEFIQYILDSVEALCGISKESEG